MAQNFKVDTLQLTRQQIRASGGNSMLYVNGVEVTSGVSGNLIQTGVQLGNTIFQTGAALVQRDLDISGVVWNYANATGSYLYSQLTGASGILNTKIVNTGQQVLTATNNNSINLSGNLFATGSGLYAMQTGMSGALKDLINAASAGVATLNTLSGVVNIIGDGNVVVTTQGQNIKISGQDVSMYTQYTVYTTGAQIISGNKTFVEDTKFLGHVDVSGEVAFDINNTGRVIDGEIDWSAGYDTLKIGTINFEQNVGFANYYRIKAASPISKGQVVMAAGTVGGSEFILGAPATNIDGSGELIMGLAAEAMGTNDFGDVISFGPLKGVNTSAYSEGSILYYSPYVVGGLTGTPPPAPYAKVIIGLVLHSASNGIIFTRVTAGSSLGGTDSNVQFSGLAAGDFIIYGADNIWHNQVPTTGNISGMSSYALVSNLAATGSTLDSKIDSLSGFVGNVSGGLETRIIQTGNAAISQANSIGQTISGNLTSTGSALFLRDSGISGGLEVRITATGTAAINQANSIGSTISGNLTSTGSTLFLRDSGISGGLEVRIAATGGAAVTYANSIGTNISGNLTATGQTLDNKINSLSGFVGNVSGGLEVRIAQTGSSAIAQANSIGSTISGNLTNTGSTLDSKINSLSGFVGNVSGGLETRITQTGTAAITQANSIGTTISGNLTTTGTLLSAIKITGSNIINLANFTGVGTVTIFASGGTIYFTGSNTDAINISGVIASTGQQAWTAANNNGINLSGNLTTTGQTLYNLTIGGDANLSGNLTQTGATLRALTLGGDTNLSGNLTLTGQTLFQLSSGTSGNLSQTGVTLLNTIFGGDANLSGNLTQTGVTLRALTLGGDTNLSGNLTTTGTLLSAIKITGSAIQNLSNWTGVGLVSVFVSGTNVYITGSNADAVNLSGSLASTGQQAWTAANNNSINLSGNLTQTGVTLRALTIGGDTNISGNLTTTGQTLDNKINSLSGFVTGASGGLEPRIALTGLSGMIYANGIGINLSGNLTTTGQTLQGRIDSLSGFVSNVSGGLEVRITQTGNAAITQANNIGVIISGNLTQTGILLIQRDNNISGVLQGYIDNISAGTGSISRDVVYTSGTQYISGTKYFIGNTYIDNLFVTGKQIVVNTEDVYVGDNWIVLNATGGARDSAIFVSTGVTGANATGGIIGFDVPSMSWVFGVGVYGSDLLGLPKIASTTDVVNASGGLEVRVTATGNAAIAQSNSIGQTISGNLTTTGSTLDSKINSLSGFVGNVSGGLETRITQTGNAAVAQANSIGSTISGNLTTTGSTLDSKINSLSGFVGNVSGGLETRITATGNAAISQANSIGQTISGNLTTTGTLLSAVKITGSNIINLANFTGVGSVNIFSSGGTIYVTGSNADAINLSGSIASTGQQAWTAANNNGINLSGNLTQTGITLRALTIGGDTNLSGNLTTTGQTLDNKINTLSGFTTGVSGGLEARIALTGLSGMIYANGIGISISGNLAQTGVTLISLIIGGDTNLSGNLTQTGVTLRNLTIGGDTNLSGSLTTTGTLLSAVKITGSSVINIANFTGVGAVSLFTSGTIIYITGSNSDGINLSGVIASTGQQAWTAANNNAINLSGNLTTTGVTLRALTLGGDTNLSGNLTQTGATLTTQIAGLSGVVNTLYGRDIVYTSGTQIISGTKTFSGTTTAFRGVGSSYVSIGHNNANITMISTGGFAGNYIYSSNVPPYTIFYRSSGDVINAPLATQNGQSMGFVSWRGFTGAAQTTADSAYIYALANSYFDTGNVGSHLIFGTANLSGVSAGVTTATEKMRITSEGNIGMGTSVPAASLHVTGAIRSNTAFLSGTTNIADIFYPRSNPSGYVTGLNPVSGWASSTFVRLTGNDFVSGRKAFIGLDYTGGISLPNNISYISAPNSEQIKITLNNGVLWFADKVSVDWNNKSLYDLNGNPSVSWDQRKLWDETGNFVAVWCVSGVGIGTATPAEYLHVTGAIRTDKAFLSGTTNLADILYPRSNPSGFINGGVVYTTGNQNIGNTKTFNSGVFTGFLLVGSGQNAQKVNNYIVGVDSVLEVAADQYAYLLLSQTGKNYLSISTDSTYGGTICTDNNIPLYLGTTTSNNLYLYTNNIDKVQIPSGGQFGLWVYEATRSDKGFYSGATNISDILYPRSNPSGFALDGVVVHRTGNETVSGSKIFLATNGSLTVSGTPVAKPTSGFNGQKSFRISQTNASVLDFGQDNVSPFGQWIQGYDNRSGSAGTYPIVLNPLGGAVGVGFNNYNPGTTLDVMGDMRVTGVVYLSAKGPTQGGRIALQWVGEENANSSRAWNIDVQGATANQFRIYNGGDIAVLISSGTAAARFYGTVRTDSGFLSGTTNLSDILYPRSNPSGFITSASTGGNLIVASGTYDLGNITVAADYTILGRESRIYCTNTNPITLTFPNANTATGYLAKIKLLNTGLVTLTGTFGQNFDGSPSYNIVGQYNSYELHSYNQNWNLW